MLSPLLQFHVAAVLTAMVFTIVAVLFSVKLIWEHISNYYKPELQRHVVRILLMCPIYAICSVIGLGYPNVSIYFDVVRDSYEAFTIFSFVKYLIAVLGGEKDAILQLARKNQIEMLFPLNHILSKPWAMGSEMVYKCKYAALQYVIIKPLCAVVVFISESSGWYGDTEWRFDRAYPYVSVASNLSQVLAMYGLLQLFFAAEEELRPYTPVPKFLSVKAVVFFTFWQGVALSFLVQIDVLVSDDPAFPSSSLLVTLQNWLVCLEMCIVAWYHNIAFPTYEYDEYQHALQAQSPSTYGAIGGGAQNTGGKTAWSNFRHGLMVGDVVKDVGAMAHLEGIHAKKPKMDFGDAVLQVQADLHATDATPVQQRWMTGVGKVQERLHPT